MDVNLSPAWLAVAEGEGVATFEALNANVRWWISESVPTTTGLSAKPNTPMSLMIGAGKTLYLSGAGTVIVLAENPIDPN